MNVRHEPYGDASLFIVDGQVDMHSSPELRQHLREAVRDERPLVVVDLGAVSFMDSSGVATLIETLKGIDRYGGTLRLAALSAPVRGVFEVSRLTSIFEIRANREDALGE